MIEESEAALVILVDALPARDVRRLGLLAFADRTAPIRPGLGYSITQKAEMLTGVLPDAQGILNHWQPTALGAVRTRPLQSVLDRCRSSWPLLDHVAHKVVHRLRGETLNIPWEQLGAFAETTAGYYDSSDASGSLITGYECIIGEDRRGGFADLETLRVATRAVEAGTSRLFVSLAELDQIGHLYGPSSSPFEEHARRLDSSLALLTRTFRDRYASGSVVIFSDHGMLDVQAGCNVAGQVFDLGRGRRARYWLDSTMVRVWGDPTDDLAAVERALVRFDIRFLTATERARFGVISPQFGALIGLLPAGRVFLPNAFGSRLPLGMHGYHPDLEEHFGVVAVAGPRADVWPPSAVSTLEFHRCLASTLSGRRD